MISKFNEYTLSPGSSRIEILDVLKKLEIDAREGAKEALLDNFECKEKEKLIDAARFHGMSMLAHRLQWALSGTAQEEGCAPKVDVNIE